MFSVAIDGPSGAGKSTIAKAVSQELGFLYVDTGALYRSIGLFALRKEKNTKSSEEISEILPMVDFELRYVKGEQRVFLSGEDVSEAIREDSVSMAASDVSAHGCVRDFLLETQRRLARENNVIMDGRDIGTVVLPDADVKIFLTADVDERARRRTKQLREKGMEADFEKIKADVIQRDYNDTHRDIAPLKQAEDAVFLDTSHMEFEESTAAVKRIIKEKYKG